MMCKDRRALILSNTRYQEKNAGLCAVIGLFYAPCCFARCFRVPYLS